MEWSFRRVAHRPFAGDVSRLEAIGIRAFPRDRIEQRAGEKQRHLSSKSVDVGNEE